MTETYQPAQPPTQAPDRRRLWIIFGLAAAVVIGGIAAVYALLFTGDSPDELTLSTPTTAAGAATGSQTQSTGGAGSELAGTWTIGTDSTAGYRVREKLVRLPATSDAVGRTNAVTGSIQVNRQGNQFVVAPGAQFEVDVSKLESDERQRDNRIRTMGLESNQYPTATFVSTAPITLPASAATAPTKTEVTGDLTIHGVTKRVTIPLDVQLNGGRIETVGSLTFPFADFGITPPSIAGVVTVDPSVTLEFQLLFSKA